ncbi:MAG: tRNA (adenosine(37)-N6)-dimethylallyltransferase MiaA [bacterium]|nr:tRNA (adenosine(37)-N6)-dimethylallyltransferase MiaA [bacterium]
MVTAPLTASLPLIVLVGPTAVGKTGLAISLAQAVGGEIVGADSRQVYRQMNTGTAKPTPEQQRTVPHHMIDLVDPDETLSLAEYLDGAYAHIDAIHQRGGVPLLVGGTGQYITALIDGWSVPKAAPDAAFRAEMERLAAVHGRGVLAERLRNLDPDAETFVDMRNPRRVIRALEVIRATGKPFSAQRAKTPPPYRVLHYGLTMARERLYAQADQRVNAMIAQGFIDEVQQLLTHGYSADLPSMSALGYREIAAYVENRTSLDEAVQAIYSATHDFIRRQYTWFRKHNADAEWLDKDTLDFPAWLQTVQARLAHHPAGGDGDFSQGK